jgi:hypothetical protein
MPRIENKDGGNSRPKAFAALIKASYIICWLKLPPNSPDNGGHLFLRQLTADIEARGGF